MVLAARAGPSPEADAALGELCRLYWFPLYAFVRRQGLSREDAEDVVQGFLTRLWERRDLQGLSPKRGRFRAYLLACLKHYLADRRDRDRALKRGGTCPHVAFDAADADRRYHPLATASPSPEQSFDREWAVALLERVLERLEDEYRAEGRERWFDELRGFLIASEERRRYVEVATRLGLEAGTVRVATHRLRKRYRQLLRDEIAQTLADPALIEEEIRSLFASFEI